MHNVIEMLLNRISKNDETIKFDIGIGDAKIKIETNQQAIILISQLLKGVKSSPEEKK